MKLYYHKTDGGAEYYCLEHIRNSAVVGDTTTWVLRTDGNEFELNARAMAENHIRLVIKN